MGNFKNLTNTVLTKIPFILMTNHSFNLISGANLKDKWNTVLILDEMSR